MGTRNTHTRFVGALVTALTAGVLLVPTALAKPTSSTAIPDAFERAVLRHDAGSGGLAAYHDAGHAQPQPNVALYPDAVERAVGRQSQQQVSGSSGSSFDWEQVGGISALAALGLVLGAGGLLTVRQRTRLA
jgi:hypothetical protein